MSNKTPSFSYYVLAVKSKDSKHNQHFSDFPMRENTTIIVIFFLRFLLERDLDIMVVAYITIKKFPN
jgi:hypothetical protein